MVNGSNIIANGGTFGANDVGSGTDLCDGIGGGGNLCASGGGGAMLFVVARITVADNAQKATNGFDGSILSYPIGAVKPQCYWRLTDYCDSRKARLDGQCGIGR